MWRSVVVALVCSGCTNPDDILPVNGTVASVDSVEGQVVRLLREVSPNQGSPFIGQPCTLAEPFKETQAGADGTYGLEVFRAETRNGGFGSICFRMETIFPSGSVAWSDLGSFASKIRVGPLRDWRAAPRLEGGVLQFEPPVPWPDDLPPVEGNYHGLQLTHREQLVTADGGIAWQADDRLAAPDASYGYLTHFEREPLLMDEFRLEDFEGTLSLRAFLFDSDQRSSFGYQQGEIGTQMRAGEQLSLRGSQVPLSRGLACPGLATPCPLTDGDLTEVDAGLINEVALALAVPTIVSAVVLRGAVLGDGLLRVVLGQEDGGVAVEVERAVPISGFDAFSGLGRNNYIRLPDGGFGSLRLAYVVIALDAGTPISRITLQFPAGLARIQEVSIFE